MTLQGYYVKIQFFRDLGRKLFQPQNSQIPAGLLLTWKARLPSQTCCHLTPVKGLQLRTLVSLVRIWTSFQWEQTSNVPVAKSLPAIFANGSSLRDLWSRDTGQLEKGKHKSLQLSRGRFTGTEMLFLKLKVWLESADGLIQQRTQSHVQCQVHWGVT